MLEKSMCVKVAKIYGEKIIVLANKMGILSKELEIQRNGKFLYIPLVRQPSDNELKIFKDHAPTCKFSTYNFPKREKNITTLTKLLEDKLPPHLLAYIPKAMDFVGDIAIIEIPPELDLYKNMIGEAILKMHKNVRTVLAKASAVNGTYRLRKFRFIVGETKTETLHREHGCKYYVDLDKVYFSPRLSYEHKRVASLVKEDEIIVDMFAGVGPFAILIAKSHVNVKVYAIDANPEAVKLLEKNIRLNRVDNKVYPFLGDAKQVVKDRLKCIADRVIMNLPEQSIEFVDAACSTLKSSGGIIHFYSFIEATDSLQNAKIRLAETVKKYGRNVEKIAFSRIVRATAPYKWQVVLDVEIR